MSGLLVAIATAAPTHLTPGAPAIASPSTPDMESRCQIQSLLKGSFVPGVGPGVPELRDAGAGWGVHVGVQGGILLLGSTGQGWSGAYWH